jgi:hypothetical protein
MKPVLLRLSSPVLQHVALLELMASSRGGQRGSSNFDMDCKVSCETNLFQNLDCSVAIPDAVRRVLADERAGALVHDLLASGALRLFVDVDALQRRCDLIAQQWRDEALLRAFVAAQASVPMIRSFFRTATRSSIVRLRRELDIHPPTKPRTPRPRELDGLLDSWRDLAAIVDLRERYLALHRACEGAWSLATLFAALDAATEPTYTRPAPFATSFSAQEPHHV